MMSDFPRTKIGNLSVPRLMPGTNWFLGFSHTSHAKDHQIKECMTRQRIASILEVFMNNGIDALYGGTPQTTHVTEAVKEVEDRTGRGITRICIPSLNINDGPEALAESERTLDAFAAMGTKICMPHQNTTDALIDRRNHRIANMEVYLKMIRDRGMIPGLSTHTPEAPVYADETGLDVEAYCQIYIAAGFLMQVEVDWVHQMIWKRKKPVITIKPLAAGRLLPIVGLGFSWGTLRDCDMIAIGTMTPEEAAESIEISRALLEKRAPKVELQVTRSKASLLGK
jgi:hypothetical protein